MNKGKNPREEAPRTSSIWAWDPTPAETGQRQYSLPCHLASRELNSTLGAGGLFTTFHWMNQIPRLVPSLRPGVQPSARRPACSTGWGNERLQLYLRFSFPNCVFPLPPRAHSGRKGHKDFRSEILIFAFTWRKTLLGP